MNILDKLKNNPPSPDSRSYNIYETYCLEKEAVSLGFTWPTPQHILDAVSKEVLEVKEVFEKEAANPARIEEEIGDALMAVLCFCNYMDLDAEEVIKKSNLKFAARFQKLRQVLASHNRVNFFGMSLEEKFQLWEEGLWTSDCVNFS